MGVEINGFFLIGEKKEVVVGAVVLTLKRDMGVWDYGNILSLAFCENILLLWWLAKIRDNSSFLWVFFW